jgi:ketosteroid isomerase-like protein
MKTLAVILLFLFTFDSFAQTNTDLQKLVETEIGFARAAETKGTKAAFLEFIADDSIVFQPAETNGKLFWKEKIASPALLIWKPSVADISSDGNLGYTTGGWESRPNGKESKATTFGQYATVWRKESDGKFKAVLDIGVSFDKSVIKPNWSAVKDAGIGEKSPKSQVDLGMLTDIYSKKLLSSGYFNHLAADAIVLREKRQPFHGKKQAFVELEKMDKDFPPDGFLNLTAKTSKNYGNLMYSWGVYQLTLKDNSIQKWNFAQVWKFRENRWQIVLDVFTPIPPSKNNGL